MLHRFLYFLIFTLVIGFAPKMGLLAKVKKHHKTELGERSYAKGNYDQALKYFKEAIDSGDSRGEAFYYIGSILEFRRKYDEALAYYEEANKRPLEKDFKKAALWKLILLHKAKQNYPEMLEYIDQMEARGINHKNFEGFREEAEKFMTPEKIEARALIKEANEEVFVWEKENSGKSFWSKTNSNADTVIGKYKRAIQLDSGLYKYKWKIAGFLEKMERWRECYRVYNDISKTDSRPIVFYKMGVMLKRLNEYRRSAVIFEKSLSKVKEDDSLNLYLYLSLSQVYYPLGEHKKGSKAATKAKKYSKKVTNGTLPFADYMRCLHEMSIYEQDTNKEKSAKYVTEVCNSVVNNTQTGKVSKWQKGMLHYLRGAYTLIITKEGEASANNIDSFHEFQMAFLPPDLQNLKQSVLVNLTDTDFQLEETPKWSPLPNWLEGKAVVVFLYWIQTEKWAEAYTLVKLYPKRIGDDYLYSRAMAEYNLELYAQVIETAGRIKNKDFEIEKIYLFALLEFHSFEDFQRESLAYAAKSSEKDKMISEWLHEIKSLRKIPLGKQNMAFIKKFFQTSVKKDDVEEDVEDKKDIIDNKDTIEEEPKKKEIPESGDEVKPVPVSEDRSTSTPEVTNTKDDSSVPESSVPAE
ncbi:MAG: tetratricopeptide repeat protein [Leptospirales bacterium]